MIPLVAGRFGRWLEILFGMTHVLAAMAMVVVPSALGLTRSVLERDSNGQTFFSHV